MLILEPDAHSESPGPWPAFRRRIPNSIIPKALRANPGRPGAGSGTHWEGLGTDLALIAKVWGRIRRSSGRPGDESCAHSGDPVLIGTVLRADPALIAKAWGRIRRSSGRFGDRSSAHRDGPPGLFNAAPNRPDERRIRPQTGPMSAGSVPRPSR